MRWFTSDLHFGHTNIIRFCNRPFEDTHHMNVAICNALNEQVGPEDELWVLGDVAMGQLDSTLPIVRRLTAGKVFLVPGNHDRCHPRGGQKAERWRERYEQAGYRVLDPTVNLRLSDGTTVLVSHFPYQGESTPGRPDRFADWRPADEGQWLLCGHVHDTYQQAGTAINVGIDAWGGRPVSEAQIVERIAEGPADRGIERWLAPREVTG